MRKEDFLRQIIEQIKVANSKAEVREIIKKAESTLDEQAQIINFSKRALFEELVKKAQDNRATMANSAEAQEIVNQLLSGKK